MSDATIGKSNQSGSIIPSLFPHEKISISGTGGLQSETSPNFHQMVVHV